MPLGHGRGGRARSPALRRTNVSPRRKGGSRGQPPNPPPPLTRRFFMVTEGQLGALVLALAVSLFLAANAAAKDFPVTVTTRAARSRSTRSRCGSSRSRRRRPRCSSRSAPGKQVVAVDDQSNYPASAPRTKLSGFTPNVEAIAKYKPDLVVGEAGLTKLAGVVRGGRDPAARRAVGADARRRLQADRRARQGDRAPRRGGRARRADEGADRGDREDGAEGQRADDRLPRARPDLLLGDVEDVHRPRLRAARPDATSPTPPTRRARATRSSRPSTSSRRARQLIVLADTKCCGQTRGERREARRAGARSRR